ncbi:MAG: Ig-like domain repeat protein [Methanobrevibacter sp.]|uniref:Ig-like domain repeat protein n=1 Tax=Methanobrevibacter sp. TaxID=66852 RepID=UPI0025F33CCF|nr:Ig-like domain repeat protein [Methanobrevibacter sp.]MBQ8018382.1 Ig-like domain repeat protein [Methanobrevibacter sp.]
MAIALIALVLICIGSVSATDEIQDGNLTVIDNSQDQSVDIDELNEESYSDDIVASDEDIVSLANEEDDALNAYDSYNQYCDELTTLTISSTGNTASVNNVELGNTVAIHVEWKSNDKNFLQGTPAESNRNIDLMKNGVLLTSKTGTYTTLDYYQGTAYFTADFEITLDSEGWWNITAHKDKTSNAYQNWIYGAADSNQISFYVPSSAGLTKKDVNLNGEVSSYYNEDGVYYNQYNDIMTFITTSESDISEEIIYKEGDVELGRADFGEDFDISTLTKGTHTITAYWAGNDDYNPAEYVFNVVILEKNIYFNLDIDDVVYPDHAIGSFSSNVIGVYTITINGKEYTVNYDEEYEESAEFNIDQLPVGTYEVSDVAFEDMENYQIDFDDEEMNDLPSFEVYDKVPTSIYVELDKNSIKKGESIVLTVSVGNDINMEEITVGNVLIYDDSNPEIAIIDLSKTNNYTFTPSYSASEDSIYIYVKYLGYDELNYNSSDEDYESYWIESPEIKDTTIDIDVDKTSLSNGETITVTPTVLVDGEEISEGTVEFYNENDDKIGAIDLNEKTSFEYTVTGESGSHSIWAKYVANDLYAESSSDKKDYKIKSTLTITLARNDDAIVVVGDTVYFTITFSDSVTDNLELWVNDINLGGEDGSSSTSVTFDPSNVGENDVFIKFLGNDDFEATESNKVTVNVVKALDTTVSIELNPDAVLPNKNITITPTVKDSEGNVLTTGVVRIYTDANMNSDPVAVINAGETGNFSDSINYPGYTGYLYAVYVPSDRTYNRSPVSAGAKYTLLYSNKLDLTVNSGSEITVNDGVSFDILATLTGGEDEITLYINDKANSTLFKNTATQMTLPVGDYTIYAKYTRQSGYYDSAVSNTVTVHVVENVKNEIIVTVESVTLPDKAEVKVTATVDGEYTIDVNGTEVNVNVDGGSGSKFVSLAAGDYYANVTGQEGAIITNAVFTVSPEPKIAELFIRDANYPENATIVLSGKGNVTITIEYYLESSVKDPVMPEIIFDGGVKKQVNAVNGVYTPVTFVVNETGEFTVNAKYKVYSFSTGELYVDAENTLTYSVTIFPQAKDISLDVEVDEEKDEDDYYTLDWGDPAFEVVTTASEDIDAEIIYKEGDKVLGRAQIGDVFEIDPNDLGLGEHTITATLEGNEDYNEASYTFTLNVDKKIIWYELEIDNVTYPDHAVGKFSGEDVDGKYTITINGTDYTVDYIWDEDEDYVFFDIKQLPAGTYTVSSIKYEDMVHYEFGESDVDGQNTLPTFTVKSKETVLNGTVLSVVNGTAPTFSIDLPGAGGNLTVEVDGKNYTKELVDGKATVEITDLPAGDYTATVTYTGDETHNPTSVPASFKVEEKTTAKEDVVLNDTVLSVVNGTAPTFSIDLPGAGGNLTVEVDGKNYTKELVDGKATVEITDLPAGDYTATVTYTGDETHNPTSVPASFKVEDKQTPDANKTFDVNVPEGSTNPVFSINLPGATGNFTVTVDGKNYTKELVNGSASITIDDLAPGAHNVTVSYSGDKNYSPMNKTTAITIPTPVLSNNKNVNVIYSANAYYRVLVIANGKAVVGEKVTITFNGKKYQVTTNNNGYATLKLPTKIKVKKYTITAEFKGVKVSNTVTVKHLFKAKNLKVKKPRKVLKIKIKTNKVNGKFLKGKKLKLKIKGKTLKAKINKKGVATFKVKKNILKKLKVGKTYKYKVTYGKDTVTKKIKIKR